ncbi:pentapeptide repeat-containing protein [Amycolatopsis sp. NPDC049253]|uniref:pentapeptide repeat-containing protein n=1 Tax=Amycolatopsis sp. NPDC049253 TaxID=3155274 RepID=UPI00342C906F
MTASLLTLWLAYSRPTLAIDGRAGSVSPTLLFDSLKVSFATIAGIGGVVALVVGYRRQRIHEAQDLRDFTRLSNERFAKAAEQIGSNTAAIRLAGVYAMAALADDWPEQRQVCIDVLCAYLRMPFPIILEPSEIPEPESVTENPMQPWRQWLEAVPTESRNPHEESHVRTTIQKVITAHLDPDAESNWFGYRFDFQGSVFEGALFEGAVFKECQVIFDGCLFYGESWFSNCKFISSYVSFAAAIVNDSLGFEFSYIEDSDLTLYFSFGNDCSVNFQGINLHSGILRLVPDLSRGAHLSFISSHLEGGTIELHRLEMTKGSSLAFSRAVIDGTEINIIGQNCRGGTIWLNGLTINDGSMTIKGDDRFSNQQLILEGTELSMDGMDLNGGTLAIRNAVLSGSRIHAENLVMNGGIIDFSEATFQSGLLSITQPDIRRGEICFRGVNFEDGDTVKLSEIADKNVKFYHSAGEVSDVRKQLTITDAATGR